MPENCAALVIAAKHHELVKVKDTRGTTNTVGALRCKFQFRTEDWLHSAKTAMFCNGDAVLHPEIIENAIAVPLDSDDECAVPYEVLTDTLPYSVGVWGITDTGLRVVSNWLVFSAQIGCYTEGNAPEDPELTVYEEILSMTQNAISAVNEVLDKANSGELDGVSATHEWNGTTLTITSASGTSSADLKGAKGDKGDSGERGEKGERGDKGETGDRGPQGLQGIQGERGVKGDTGEKGAKGDPFTYADFTQAQLASLKGDKGDRGDKGEKGDKGDQGAQGAKGDKGEQGISGVYVGGGEMPEGYNVQIDPNGEDAMEAVISAVIGALTWAEEASV